MQYKRLHSVVDSLNHSCKGYFGKHLIYLNHTALVPSVHNSQARLSTKVCNWFFVIANPFDGSVDHQLLLVFYQRLSCKRRRFYVHLFQNILSLTIVFFTNGKI